MARAKRRRYATAKEHDGNPYYAGRELFRTHGQMGIHSFWSRMRKLGWDKVEADQAIEELMMFGQLVKEDGLLIWREDG